MRQEFRHFPGSILMPLGSTTIFSHLKCARITLPETIVPENWWLEVASWISLSGWPIFRRYVSFREGNQRVQYMCCSSLFNLTKRGSNQIDDIDDRPISTSKLSQSTRVGKPHGCFPKIVGFPPKSSTLIGFSIINHPFWGTTIFGNTHIFLMVLVRSLGSTPPGFQWQIKVSVGISGRLKMIHVILLVTSKSASMLGGVNPRVNAKEET